MSNAKTIKELEVLLEAHKGNWPPSLLKAGMFALLSLKEVELNKTRPINKAVAVESSAKYSAAFEKAYAEWKMEAS